MFCQACGARNTGDARFCNMCGARIASPGTSGGPVGEGAVAESDGAPAPAPGTPPPQPPGGISTPPPGAPSPGTSNTGITLARIGVQSPRRIWTVVAILAGALMGLGALIMWLVSGDDEAVAEAGHAEPDDPFVIGTPLPQGEDTPDQGFLEEAESAEGDGPAADGDDPESGTESETAGSGGRASGGRTGAAADRSGRAGTRTGAGSEAGSEGGRRSGSGAAAGSGEGTEAGSGQPGDGAGGGGGPGTGGGGDSGGAEPGAGEMDAPEERDIGMELYGARVRYVVRRYYASRAQACFDRATRNNPAVSGTVLVGLTIGADGQVTDGSVVRNSTGDASLGACLTGQVRQWKLPPPPGGSLQMEMPFSR